MDDSLDGLSREGANPDLKPYAPSPAMGHVSHTNRLKLSTITDRKGEDYNILLPRYGYAVTLQLIITIL